MPAARRRRRPDVLEQSSPYISLLLITLLAVVVPIALSRVRFIRVPIVVGEIIAGIVIGTSGLDIVRFTPTLSFLSEFGFAFLMFLSGLEVDVGMLFGVAGESSESKWKNPLTLAVVYLSATVGLALIFGYTLTSLELARSPILMALILSTTSLGVVVPILKERGLTVTRYGQAVLIGALVSDFITLILLSGVIAVLNQGFSFELMLSMLLIVAFVVSIRISRHLQRLKRINRMVSELSHATAQIRVRGSLALLVVFVVLAESLGVELILGAFLAGVVVRISSRENESPLPLKLDAIGYGFFIPIFFITVGAKFDLGSLTGSPAALLLLPLMIVAAYVVKMVPAVIYRTVFPWRETIGLGVLLSSRLSLIIAASAIALEMELISSATNSAVILVAILTCTFSPIVFQGLISSTTPAERTGIAIFGTHQLALLLAQRLSRTGENIIFMSRFDDRLESVRELGYEGVKWDFGDGAKPMADISRFRAFIAVTNSTEVLVEVCRTAKELYAIPTVIARVDEPETARELQKIGVGVVQPTTAVAVALESALLYPAAYDLLVDTEDDVEVVEIRLLGRQFDGSRLSRINVPGNALIVGVRRGGETIVPHGDTVVRSGDTLVMIGDPDSLGRAGAYFAA